MFLASRNHLLKANIWRLAMQLDLLKSFFSHWTGIPVGITEAEAHIQGLPLTQKDPWASLRLLGGPSNGLKHERDQQAARHPLLKNKDKAEEKGASYWRNFGHQNSGINMSTQHHCHHHHWASGSTANRTEDHKMNREEVLATHSQQRPLCFFKHFEGFPPNSASL